MAGVISESARDEILRYLRTFMANAISAIRPVSRAAHEFRPTRSSDEEGDIKPFHEALVPEGVLRTSDFERSFSTSLGTTFEEVAKIIGAERFEESRRGFRLQVSIPRVALDTIDGIMSDISSDGMSGRYLDFIQSVAQAYRGDAVNRRPLTIDLYLRESEGIEHFFEMKSPKPNKDGAVGAVRKLLTAHGVRGAGPPRVNSYYAMAYNPYGDTRGLYTESVARKYLDFNNMVLVGSEFWDFVGGIGTYPEVLELYGIVGRELGPQVWQAITGFT